MVCQLLSRDEALAEVEAMDDPMIVADTCAGSAQTRFKLIDYDDPIWMLDQCPEVSREEFNAMRQEGILDLDPENRVKVDRFQAWRFTKGASDGGEE